MGWVKALFSLQVPAIAVDANARKCPSDLNKLKGSDVPFRKLLKRFDASE